MEADSIQIEITWARSCGQQRLGGLILFVKHRVLFFTIGAKAATDDR